MSIFLKDYVLHIQQLDCALGSGFISKISHNRRELRPDTHLPSPYYLFDHLVVLIRNDSAEKRGLVMVASRQSRDFNIF